MADVLCDEKVQVPELVPAPVLELDAFFASLDPYTWEPPAPEFRAILLTSERLRDHEGDHLVHLPTGEAVGFPRRALAP